MPQDTTIYLDGNGQLPRELVSLPQAQQQQIIEEAYKKEQAQKDEISITDIFGITLFVVFVIIAILRDFRNNQTKQPLPLAGVDDGDPLPVTESQALVYSGNKLKFTDELMSAVLTKRFPFYNSLDAPGKEKFIIRLKKFIALKTFIIHDTSGFKEMPILVSATAVQICFGLDKYLLPNFNIFNIYPCEFIGTYPSIRILIGNVTGNTINLSWKHLLDGLNAKTDGQNVGVHELAHALYYQTFIIEKNVDREFRDTFIDFDSNGNKVYDLEKSAGQGLYSDYAMKDFQEFWAESVDIFFEKPLQMKALYPELYLVMSDLLNQDPARNSYLGYTA